MFKRSRFTRIKLLLYFTIFKLHSRMVVNWWLPRLHLKSGNAWRSDLRSLSLQTFFYQSDSEFFCCVYGSYELKLLIRMPCHWMWCRSSTISNHFINRTILLALDQCTGNNRFLLRLFAGKKLHSRHSRYIIPSLSIISIFARRTWRSSNIHTYSHTLTNCQVSLCIDIRSSSESRP